MVVLVTGATGFVGRHLVRALLAAGHQVKALVRSPEKATQILGDPLGDAAGRLQTVAGDVLAPASIVQAVAGCDAAVHLVGIIKEKRGATFRDLHVRGTANVLAAATRAGVSRLVHMSALGARDGAQTGYHQTKWEAEELVRNSGLRAVIFRPSIIYGPGDEFVNMLAGLIRRVPVFPVFGDGCYRLQPVWVEDVAYFFTRALEVEGAVGETLEVGGPQRLTYGELVAEIMRVTGRRRPQVHLPLNLTRRIIAAAQRVRAPLPVTSDQLTMLLEGSTCNLQPLLAHFPRDLRFFADGIADYL